MQRKPPRPPSTAPLADQVEQARTVAVNAIDRRMYASADLVDLLTRRGFDPLAVTEVLDRLTAVGLLDDAAYARAFRSHHRARGLSDSRINTMLARSGIVEETAGEELAIETTDEDRARALVQAKLARVTRIEDSAKLTRSLVGLLARKGYSPGIAYRVVAEEIRAHGVPREEEAADEAGMLD